jgi:glycine/D-amino acid oxidase-like deaminating enzyme
MKRRRFLGQMGATLALSSVPGIVRAGQEATATRPAVAGAITGHCSTMGIQVAPVRARVDRITDVRVGLRPFRRAGPRIEAQRLGAKTIVHNYGHGGAGWSLSWGSSTLALRLVRQLGGRSLAVLGCGAMGLTTAVLARQAGFPVCIYTKDLPSDVYSMAATGLWTPDAQLCAAGQEPAIAASWREMAGRSFAMYQTLLGLPGKPVEWIRGFSLSDTPFGDRPDAIVGEPPYGKLRDAARDFIPRFEDVCAGSHPFPQPYVRGWTTLMFNIGTYAHMLLMGFLASGGSVKLREIAHASDLFELKEDTIVNATGYGARKLFDDDSVIPIRGQIARLIPQQEVTYGLSTSEFNIVPRSDGLVVRSKGHGGDFNNSNDAPNPFESESVVRKIAEVFDNMRRG